MWGSRGKFEFPEAVCRETRQLPGIDVDRLIEEYESGKAIYELWAEFGVHRATPSRFLK